MKKQFIVALGLCTLQTMHGATIKPMPVTNTVVAATAPALIESNNSPQPLQISEKHISGHSQPSPSVSPTLIKQKPANQIAPITSAIPVTTATNQSNTTSMEMQPTQTAPISLTPNTPGSVSPTAIKKQLKDLQDHITQVSQQLDMLTTTK